MSYSHSSTDSDYPLCVDLDGSFVKTDMLFESTLCLLKTKPWLAFSMIIWLLKGKAQFKSEICKRTDLSGLPLPINDKLLEELQHASKNRKVILVTGSNQGIADVVKHRYPFFTDAYGSDEKTNLTGNAKRTFLVDRYGERGYDYVGNDKPDRVVWSSSRKAHYAGFENDIEKFSDISFEQDFSHKQGGLLGLLKMVRLHQWTKNFLVFVPLFLDQQLGDVESFLLALLGFLAFSLLASATYIINDLLDLPSDRLNSTKKFRPLASGSISIKTGLIISLFFLLLALILGLILPLAFSAVLAIYLVTTLAYSFVLKTQIILDVITIAVLHTFRIVGGTLVIGAEHSFWLLAFSLFIFTSFALAKRVSELTNLQNESGHKTRGRDYTVSDIPLLTSAGVSAGYMAVLVLALYINSDKVLENYNQPEILWILCPGFLYWIGRLWLMTSRGRVHEDPIVYVLRDKASLLTLLCFLLVVSTGFLI